jgi:YXWGXW repeat-containing protein
MGARIPRVAPGTSAGIDAVSPVSADHCAKEDLMIKRTALILLAGAALFTPAAFTPAAAQSLGVNISIGTPPPPPIYEAVPAPRVGYVWAPGYWRWEHERHIWAPGHWMAARPGHRWVADRWVEGPHGHWHHDSGHWERG